MIKLFGMMLSTTENLYEEEIWSQLSDYVVSPEDRILFFVVDLWNQHLKMKLTVTLYSIL